MSIFHKLTRWFRGPDPTEPEPRDLFALLNLAWTGQAVYVATKLGVADQLANGPATCAQLAEALEANEDHLQQVMRALAGFGIFAKDESGRYDLTPMAESLQAGDDSWMRQYVLLWGEQLYPACGQMLEMTQSDQTAFALAHGQPLYEHYKSVPEAGQRFVDFMNAVTDWQRNIVVDAYDFRDVQHLVDVGGGRASMLTAILAANPHLKGTILDQPHMAEPIEQRINESNLGDRCEFAGGSFLEEVVSGADFYLIKHVLHDWPDNDVATILKNVHAAMPDDATLMIIEGVLNDDNGIDRVMKMRDLEQMIWTGGRVRTQAEFEHLLGDAGFTLDSIQRTALIDTCLIIAHKSQP